VEPAHASLEEILEHFQQQQTTTIDGIASLQAFRQQIQENEKKLESPQAAYDYIDFFMGFFTRATSELQRVGTEVASGVQGGHLEALRQLASNAAAEQRRCLQFRDKWINRPLPYEDVRPLLTDIANVSRDLLNRYRDLNIDAAQLEALLGPPPAAPADGKALDRRELFTKWFGR
jgi:hypothetical protein